MSDVADLSFADLTATVDALFPPATAEPWDRVGVVWGEPTRPVRRVLLTVDVTPVIVKQATDLAADAIIAHHPLLLRGVHGIDPRTAKGRMVTDLVRAGIGLQCVHTNGDIGPTGTVAALAERLGLADPRPLAPRDGSADTGLGRIGTVVPTTVGDFAALVAERLPRTAVGVRVAGELHRPVRTVAVQAGAGDDLLDTARDLGADLYLTSDLRHHPASESMSWQESPALLDVSHWAAEWCWLPVLASLLTDTHPELEVVVSEICTDPWSAVVGGASQP